MMLVPVSRSPHAGDHAWNPTCGPTRGDYSWCQRREQREPLEAELADIRRRLLASRAYGYLANAGTITELEARKAQLERELEGMA
jgi:hypothetical protein